jgi:hypothetical protein
VTIMVRANPGSVMKGVANFSFLVGKEKSRINWPFDYLDIGNQNKTLQEPVGAGSVSINSDISS